MSARMRWPGTWTVRPSSWCGATAAMPAGATYATGRDVAAAVRYAIEHGATSVRVVSPAPFTVLDGREVTP